MSNDDRAFDKFGNPIGHEYDFGGGDEARLQGEKVLLYSVLSNYETNLLTGPHLPNAMSQRNLKMDVIHHALGGQSLDDRLLGGYSQLWFLSDDKPVLDNQQIDIIVRYVEAGNGLAVWADNEPFYADANRLTQRLISVTFSGNRTADQIMVPGDRLSPGHFIDHPLTQGVNNLYEGITICTISNAPGLKYLAQSHDGQICMAAYEQGHKRIVLDSGFTKLYEDRFERTAGTARYLRNIAFWLAHGSRDVEYTLFTPGRENLATISQGQLSQGYKYSLTQPGTLAYILTWSGSATLGIVVRDPHGRTVHESASATSPLRIEIPTTTLGDWVCQVKGMSTPKPNFPYVLTLALERGNVARGQLPGNAQGQSVASVAHPLVPDAQVAPQQPPRTFTPPADGRYLPVNIVLDGSLLASSQASALKAGFNHLVTRLRGRAQRSAAVYLSISAADGTPGSWVPPTPPTQWPLANLGTGGGSNQLGTALRQTLTALSTFSTGGKPLVFVLLGSAPNNEWMGSADQMREMATRGKLNVIVLGLQGYTDPAVFKRLGPGTALVAPMVDEPAARQLFDWMYSIVDAGLAGIEAGVKRVQAPAPPPFLRSIG